MSSPSLQPFELNLLGSEYGNMLSCVRCGQCLTSCPTYVLSGREAEGPRGRVALARAVHDGVLPLTPELLQHESNCLICDACTAVCPAGVHMDPLQVAFRSAVESQFAFTIFSGMRKGGCWYLHAQDGAGADTGSIQTWRLYVKNQQVTAVEPSTWGAVKAGFTL